MKTDIANLIKKSINTIISNDEKIDFIIEHPVDFNYGDYSTNVAMILAKQKNQNPRELAEKIAENLRNIISSETEKDPSILQFNPKTDISKIEVAGPGFINFYLTAGFFKKTIQQIINGEMSYGHNHDLNNKKIVIEYTDPNPFKQFHIGHLMPNTIGEAIARILEWNGAKVTRVCYQGDVGMHVAKAIWAMNKKISEMPNDLAPLENKIKFIGDCYTFGSEKYETDEISKTEINEINKKVYELFDDTKTNDDPQIKRLYDKGKEWSLIHFNQMYEKLGTTFDQLIFESQMAEFGSKIVKENVPEIFELSDGAVVYKGEKDGLHTRVFINSLGLPTYEAKDIGLAYYKDSVLAEKFISVKPKTGDDRISKIVKNKIQKFDASIIITGGEQKDYYKVVRTALSKLNSEIAEKTLHITNGMLRFADGKMSSRKGNIITASELLRDIENTVFEKLKYQSDKLSKEEFEKTKSMIAVSSIKYSILKQSVGKDIVFDKNSAVSFEGDSGPYLQYSYVRAKSLVEKATAKKINFLDSTPPQNWQITNLEKLLYRFPESVKVAYSDLAPQYILTLLVKIAGEFNSFYGNQIILDNSPNESYKVAIAKATMHVLQNGLKILGIKVPERM
ncbi:MAG TPA: arginine--tRNA ligase [Candidatus Paceibacterota bacterium]|nr:arginine--tRNA ligase [Candidatus Paceibacterota bacterium]HMP18935.1 arginine--tRNA ligase [Candidatus Paceibacterota bacterium]HMP85494.1 arginine--tRNA ligase [Candidatus Paceibacterota bacterium]